MAKRILVVEDNDLNRKLFCDLLRAKGFEVEPVADGREAIEKTRLFMPQLVVMDIQLPNVSGIDLIEAIKADDELKAIPILAVTAYAGKGDEETIRAAGAGPAQPGGRVPCPPAPAAAGPARTAARCCRWPAGGCRR